MLELVALAGLGVGGVAWLFRKRQQRQPSVALSTEKRLPPLNLPPRTETSRNHATPSDHPYDMDSGHFEDSDRPVRRVIFEANRPEGEWVNWKIGSGWFEVAGVRHRARDVRHFLSQAERAQGQGQPFGVLLEPEPGNLHDANAIQVYGWTRNADDLEMRIFLGYVPRDVAAEVARLPIEMPRAAELKRAAIGDRFVVVTVAGLIPSVKQRRDLGLEEAPPKAPSSLQLAEVDIAALERLMERLETTKPLTAAAADRLSKRSLGAKWEAAAEGDGIVSGEDSAYEFLSLPDAEREAFMRAADNDLGKQVQIVDDAFDAWFERGYSVAPYYPHRIAIILSKGKRKDLEKRFLASWCRHFPIGNGAKYETLAKRARKLGVNV